MNKEEKINKIIEMSREMMIMYIDSLSDDEIDSLYISTKTTLITLEGLKKLRGDNNE